MKWRLTFLTITLAMACPADTLRLRSGESVNGTFLGASADDIRFEVGDDVQHFARSGVAQIILGPAVEAPCNAPSTPPAGSAAESNPERGPDFAGAPFLRGASGYIPLEREFATATRSGGMYGMGGTVYRVQGARSPVRVRQSDRIVFVVRFDSGSYPANSSFTVWSRAWATAKHSRLWAVPRRLYP